ncbi:hypothetical protein KDK88_04075 [bacterium]|nr:hypothetical protein [bacterium]
MELFIVQTIVIGLLLYVVAKLTPGMEVDGVGQALLLSVLSFGATLIM